MPERSGSIDGKTMRGVHGEGVIGHILTLLTHETIRAIGQVGVNKKENEIPAAHRLISQVPASLIQGLTLVADAIHTQTETARRIRAVKADYLLMVKGNQGVLEQDIATYFHESHEVFESASDNQYGHGSQITTTVTISHSPEILTYLSNWTDISTIGMIHRTGTRRCNRITTGIDETVYFIASTPDLTAIKALRYIRYHWKIENNLHRTKDILYHEDQQTVRLGTAPQVVTYLRSMAINLLSILNVASMSQTVRTFQFNQTTHHNFVRWAAIV